MSDRFDIAIIGSGPAGLSAALIAKIRNKSFKIFGDKTLSNHMMKAPEVNGYLGFSSGRGKDLLEIFKDHINKMEIEITEERVSNIYDMGDYFQILVENKTYESLSVILATGVEYVAPLKGEEKFVGRGVAYCTTCDGQLYKGKSVAIVSYLKEGESEANFMSEIADKVYYIPLYEGNLELNENIEIINDTPIEIIGNTKVNRLALKNSLLDIDGIFVLKNAIPPTELVPGLELENGHIKVDVNMKTNLPGCFAAGDCAGKPYQDIKSAGQGNTAALSAVDYLTSI